MKIPLLVLVLLACVLCTRAQTADDQYVRIYNLIQQADSLETIGHPTEALAKYLEARSSLERFQKAYPEWNARVVKFRLSYLADKVSAITKEKSPTTTNDAPQKAVGTEASSASTPAAPSVTSNLEAQLSALQEQNRQLQSEKVLLQAKLKEALAVQPPSTDPRELAAAQEKLTSLEKENQLLKVTLAQQKAKSAPGSETNNLPQQTEALAEANRKLAQQTELASNLANDNRQLQTKLDQALSRKGAPAVSEMTKKALADANARLAQQTALANKLATEKESLQARVKKLETEADSAIALRAENQVLKKQLADLKAAPASAVAGKKQDDPGQKLALAQAQIATLQSDKELLRLEKIALENRLKQISASGPTNFVAAFPSTNSSGSSRTNISPRPASPTTTLASAPVPQPDAKASAPLPPTTSSPVAASQFQDALRIKQLETERDDLQKRLDAVLKQGVGRKSKNTTSAHIVELESQMAALRARLEVFEAKQVPYTAEELALFKQPGARLAPATANTTRKPAQKMPAGSATLLAEAQRHFSAKQFDQAEEKYLQVLRQDDKNVYTLANLAAIELERNRLTEADTHIKRAIAAAPDDAYSLSILGYLRYRQQNYDEALDALSRAAQLDADSAEIQNFLGLTLSHKGMRGPAETAFRKAIQIDPNYGKAHNNLAAIYLTQQPPLVELARWHYQKALVSGHPHNPELERDLDTKRTAQSGR